MEYTYRDIKKDVFINGHERTNVVEDRKAFLKTMSDLELYLVEFNSEGNIKDKIYPDDCQVGGTNCQSVIVITYNECMFSANNGKTHGWQRKGDIFLCPKRKGRGIMVSDFLLLFSWLNLFRLFQKKQHQVIEHYGLSSKEAVEILEYGKNNEDYWDRVKLVKQVKKKALPIAEALYLGYSLLFLFDNATSHSVYLTDVLWVKNMSKRFGGKKAFLRNGWYFQNGLQVIQKMYTENSDETRCQKSIQKVLEERNLWPIKGLKLACLSFKCLDCQIAAECKYCVKRIWCEGCKNPKKYNGIAECTSQQKCDACVLRQVKCQCIPKKYCSRCEKQKRKCGNYEELPLKCSSNGNKIFYIFIKMII